MLPYARVVHAWAIKAFEGVHNSHIKTYSSTLTFK